MAAPVDPTATAAWTCPHSIYANGACVKCGSGQPALAATADARYEYRAHCVGCGHTSGVVDDEELARRLADPMINGGGKGCETVVERRLITVSEWEHVDA